MSCDQRAMSKLSLVLLAAHASKLTARRSQLHRDFLPIWSCSVWGLPCPLHYCRGGALLPHLFTLTLALPPRRYIFCGTFRRADLNPPSRTLSGTLLCGVRTFLPPPPKKRRATVRSGCQRFIIWERSAISIRYWCRTAPLPSLPGL